MKIINRALVSSLISLSLFSLSTYAQEAQQPLEIVVTADRKARTVDDTLAPVTILTRQQIEQYQASSVPELLQHIPSLNLTNDGGAGKNTSVAMRGTNASHVLVLIDGIKIGSATLGSVAWADLPVDAIERIEVVRGPRSSLYGSEAIGGVIQIFTRKGGKGFKPDVSLSVGSHATQKQAINLGVGDSTTWYNLNAAHEQTDGFNACVDYAACFTNEADKDGYKRDQVTMRAGHRFKSGSEAEISLLRAKGDNQFDGSFNNETKFVQQVVSGKLRQALGDQTLVTVQLGQARDNADNYLNGKPLTSYRFYNTQRTTASVQADRTLNSASSVSVGIDQQQDKITSDSAYARTKRDNTGVFANYQSKIGKNHIDIAARYDDNQQFGSHRTGSIALGRELARDKRLTLAYGTAFKAPTFNDLYYPYSGNPNLKPESSRNLELGLRGKWPQGQWQFNAFSNQIEDLIAWQADAAGNWLPANVNTARIQGLEFSATTRQRGWDFNASATLQQPENRSGLYTGKQLIYRPQQLARLDADRTLGKVRVGTTLRAESKRYTDAANTDTLAGYGTVDLRADYPLAKYWTIAAKLNNVLDKQYQTNKGYQQDGVNGLVTLKYSR